MYVCKQGHICEIKKTLYTIICNIKSHTNFEFSKYN